MINVRERAFSILTGHFAETPITVYQTRIDPFKLKNLPAIEVVVNSIKEEQKSHDWIYDVNAGLEISVFLEAKNNYAEVLDSVVAEVKLALFEDDDYLADVEFLPVINNEFAYISAGDINVACARLSITASYVDEYSFEDRLPYLLTLFATYTIEHNADEVATGEVGQVVMVQTDTADEFPEEQPLWDSYIDANLNKINKLL